MAKRRFEFDDGGSSKFWEIELAGDRHIVCYGRLGTAGRTVEKRFAAVPEAKEAADKLIREKTKQGYREVTRAASKLPPRGKRLLLDSIYREAQIKGAAVDQNRELPRSVKRCPDFIAEFYRHIVWPRRREFDAAIGDEELSGISFDHPVQEVPAGILQGVAGCRGKDLFVIGSQQGGNKVLLLDGNDRNTSDPTVYEVDHHPEPGDRIWKYGRLSRFLRSLRNP